MQLASYALDILVNGKPLPLESMPVQSILLCSSKYQRVPVGELVISDPSGVAATVATFTDGTPVVIALGRTIQTQVQYAMRIFKIQKVQGASGTNYRIILYADAYLYWRGTANIPLTSTAADAIQSIASTCGLQVYTEKTSDYMTWLPLRSTYSAWAESISRAAYLDNGSGFAFGLRLDGMLVLRNVGGYTYTDAAIPTFVGGYAAADLQQGKIPLRSFKHGVISGYKNLMGGYHAQLQTQTVMSATSTTSVTTVSKVRATQQLHMDTTVKGELVNAPIVNQSFIDCGNTHDHYLQAIYQNSRIDQVFSSRLTLLTDVQSQYDLLDRVKVDIYDMPVSGTTPELDRNLSGNYHIIGKSVYADVAGTYAEKFITVTDGHNADPGSARSDV